MAEERFLLKDLFDRPSVGVVADAIAGADRSFDREAFLTAVFDNDWPGRELKERMRHIAVTIRHHVAGDYRQALDVLLRATSDTVGAGFAAMAFSDFVEVYGLDDPAASLPALRTFTRVVSAEFAVRPFLLRYPEETVAEMGRWAEDPDPRVRRLASEGCRPRLPWGMTLPPFREDPAPILPILETLRHDPSEDVRRSVANNLNDIAKDHPTLVIETLGRWQDGRSETTEITRHALRTLLKRGNPEALRLLGFHPEPRVVVGDLALTPARVPIGGEAHIEFTVTSEGTDEQGLLIDLVVFFRKARGQLSPKVFRVRTLELAPGKTVAVRRKISVQPLSTRRIYPGAHAVEVQVNGTRMGRVEFEVLADSAE